MEVIGSFWCNMLDFILVIIFVCLVVDVLLYGKGVGVDLFYDVVLWCYCVVENIGVCVIMVYVFIEEVKGFYVYYGFKVL